MDHDFDCLSPEQFGMKPPPPKEELFMGFLKSLPQVKRKSVVQEILDEFCPDCGSRHGRGCCCGVVPR